MADIAINPVSRRVQYTGNTGLGPFAFTFNILADADIAVYKNTTLLTLTSEYTVTTNANGTGSITLTGSGNGTALIASDVLTIIGARQLERTTDFVAGGDFFAASINEQLDSQVIMAQQLDEKLTRAIKVNPGDEFTDLELPLKADRIGKTLQFNATTGDPEAGPSIADVANAQTYATNAAASETAAATSASSASSSASAASSSATNAASSATAAAASETAAAASESAAATSETNAANSASSASTAASNAAASASAAATSESNAASSASAAASSETAAQTAQTAAETARDQTLAAYDNFDDRYLGAKASDPTLDNDGNALVGGALYYNTTDEAMKVYTGSAWVAAYASLSGALLVNNNLSDLSNVSAARTNLGLGTAATSASTDFVAVTGDSMTGDLSFGDSNKAIFGAGSDLQIYHDGSNSIIADSGTGNLQLNGNEVTINSTTGSNIAFDYRPNASHQVRLYYGGSDVRLATTSAGVTVTGTISATNSNITNAIGVQGTTTVYTSSTTYTPTSGAKYALVELQGGGGGGGGCASANSSEGSAGSGGGGGAYIATLIDVSGYTGAATLTVGAGGAGGPAGANNGSDGGDTSYVDTGVGGSRSITALGGSGGKTKSNITGSNNEEGGSGGATTGDGANDIVRQGTSGGLCQILDGSSGNGAVFSGAGGDSMLGRGGRQRKGDSVGIAGTSGAGGSGGAQGNSSNNKGGGDGGNGRIIITEFF